MEESKTIAVLGALSSPVRLRLYRLLVRHGAGGLVAGELCEAMGLPAANVSFHLKALARAGLVAAEQEGRFQRYRPNIPLMLALIAYLTEECCADDPQVCAQFREASAAAGLLPARTPTSRRR